MKSGSLIDRETKMRRYCGIDVGKYESHVAIIKDREIVELSLFDDNNLPECYACGVDAPLNVPHNKTMRNCEQALRKMGVGVYPSGAEFFLPIVKRGIEIAELMEDVSIVYEIYPFASRKFLNLAPKAKKQTKKGRKQITEALKKYVNIRDGSGYMTLSHDELDAIIGVLTVKMYCEGKGLKIGNGIGRIIVPEPVEIKTGLDKWG